VTLEIGDDGTIAAPEGPGLGVVPDFDALEAYRVG
jgi:L-alanine-DL-glutamate epimerase-like enolase superfamily enzyme